MQAPPQSIAGHEVAQLLREAIVGRLKVRLEDPAISWRGVYCGLIYFRIAGWRLRFFNDCNSLDYCDSAESPDGQIGTFSVWLNNGEEPVSLLNEAEQRALYELFDASV